MVTKKEATMAVTCGHCSTREVKVQHASADEARRAHTGGGVAVLERPGKRGGYSGSKPANQMSPPVQTPSATVSRPALTSEQMDMRVATGGAPGTPTHLEKVVFDGIYTLVDAEGGHRTFRLRTEAKDSPFKPGEQIIGHLVGSNNESDYQGFGTIVGGSLKVWFKHRGNLPLIEAAQALLTDTQGKIDREEVLFAAHCFRCRRLLTVPTSVHQGLGPECAKKG